MVGDERRRTFGDLDAVESMFASASFGADERDADAVLGASALGFDDGGYAVSSEARGDMGPGADANFAARVVGKSLGDAVADERRPTRRSTFKELERKGMVVNVHCST